MNMSQTTFELARERQERLIEEHLQGRVRGPRSSIRQFVGRRVIAVGKRIAAEPSLELARSR